MFNVTAPVVAVPDAVILPPSARPEPAFIVTSLSLVAQDKLAEPSVTID